jgi:Protein of unknown function (DUF2946)
MSQRRGRALIRAPAFVGRGVLLALLAIALQIVVGATHHHNRLFAGSFAASGAPNSTVTGLAAADRRAAPSELPNPPTPDDQDACPLCWGLHVAGAFLLPQIAPAATPTLLAAIVATWQRDYGLPSQPFSLFRTRAPPTV